MNRKEKIIVARHNSMSIIEMMKDPLYIDILNGNRNAWTAEDDVEAYLEDSRDNFTTWLDGGKVVDRFGGIHTVREGGSSIQAINYLGVRVRETCAGM